MGFLKKITKLLTKQQENISFSLDYEDDYIALTPNLSSEYPETVIDLINMYYIKRNGNKLYLNYREIYDLYYDENNIPINSYEKFGLPEIFKGFIYVENVNNFMQDDDVKYAYSFEGHDGEYEHKKGNIIECFMTGDIKIISPEVYELIRAINNYNQEVKMYKNVASQFEMLNFIKDYSEKMNLILNKRLSDEEKPMIVDKIKIDFKDDGSTLEILPVFSEDNSINSKILNKLDNSDIIKDFYSVYIDGRKVKFVIKNKSTIEQIKKRRKNTGQKRLEILSGKDEIFEDDNIDLSAFGPRVIGMGYLNYRSYPATAKTSDLKWVKKDVDFPHFFCGSEKVTLKPQNIESLETKLREMNEKEEDWTELQFKSDYGNNVKTTISKEQLKNEIIKLKNTIVSPTELHGKRIIENIIDIYDKCENDKYIELNGMYIEKYDKEFFNKRLFEINNTNKKNNHKEKEKALLIYENLEEEEYNEDTDGVGAETLEKVEISAYLKDSIKLFDYQKEAVKKLQSLYLQNPVNGFLLCDDMGLGKTLQLLSFLAWLKEKDELTPSLIVAPTSLLNNWDDSNGNGEIQKFFKDNTFRTIKIRGNIPPEEIEHIKSYDLVFTTYESLRANNKEFGEVGWKIMVCDEAQKIKNPLTQVTVAAKAQNAGFKIVCSATPIENTLIDLWNLVDYSKPGLLRSLKEFKNFYVSEAKNASFEELKNINDELYQQIEKFYIRREKDILPKELPNKNLKIYKRVANQYEKEYLDRVQKSESSTLAMIQKMLLASCHVDLLSDIDINEVDIEKAIRRSTKLEILHDILKEIKTNNEKGIIFVRSVKMQQLIYKSIDYWFGIKVNIINGKITNLDDRTRILNIFREYVGFSIIILSPEVAGFGITLTEANHVIHYMRLWNPAKEDQATDRAYRIGQTNDVIVHYPILSFSEETVYEYDNVTKYVNDNIEVTSDVLSPEEKLNILLARKKNMLLNFFLAAGSGEISESEFLKLGTDNKPDKNTIIFKDIEDGIIDPFEFEALVALIFERQGYVTFLTSCSNDNGVDVICVKDEEILLIQCKKVKKLDSINTIKDLLYARDIYTRNVGFNNFKLLIVTNTKYIPEKVKTYDEIDTLDGQYLEKMLLKYSIYKDEIDIKNNERYSFEVLKQKLNLNKYLVNTSN